MNLTWYKDQVLNPILKPFYMQMHHERKSIYFQQDGAASHRSKSTINWFSQNQIPLFDHPALSRDLNPIEPTWLDLKNILCHLRHPRSTVELLRAAVLDAWEQLPMEQIDGHIRKMGDCVEAVLKDKGGHTAF
jgi:DDE superfamily endonuclease